MKEIVEAIMRLNDNQKNSILLNEIAELYREVDELKTIIKNLKAKNNDWDEYET